MSPENSAPPAAASTAAARAERQMQAEQHLQSNGLRALDRNWRCPAGEIAIIAAYLRVLVVCDVRTVQERPGARSQNLTGTITKAKSVKLRRLAIRWIIAHGLLFDELRVDVVYIIISRSGELTIKHVSGTG